MTDPRTWLIVVLAAATLFFALRGDAATPDPDAELKTEDLIETMRDRGFFVYASDPELGAAELVERIAELEGDTARLAGLLSDAVEDARIRSGELRGVLTAHANATATIRDQAAVIDSLTADGEPVSVSTEIEDETFGGWLRFNFEPQTFDAELSATPRFGLTITEAPDGRYLFGIVPEDPRVTPVIEQAAWTPPPPIYQCTWGERIRAGAVGGGIVGTAAAIAALLGG